MIALRPLSAADSGNLLRWRNLPEVREFMYADHEITRIEHERWLLGALSDESRKYWIIVYDHQDIGLVSLRAIDRKNRHCYWAFYIGEPIKGRGIGSAVEYKLIEIVFNQLSLNRMCCEVLSTNPSLEMHKRMGFKVEGIMREHAFKEGKPVDVVLLALLKSAWEQIRPQVEAKLLERGLLPVEEIPIAEQEPNWAESNRSLWDESSRNPGSVFPGMRPQDID